MSNTKWNLDAVHSEVQFKIKHLMISTITGRFNKFEGTVETDGDDFTTAKINFSAEIDSINTNNEARDGHLKAGDFFDAATHPKMSFVSSKLEKIDEETYKLHGDLALRGITKPVSLNVNYGGITLDPWGGTRAGFELEGKINRKDFGLNFHGVTETGGIMLGDDVRIIAEVEFVKEAVGVTA